MFGSNFPVDKLNANFDDLFAAYKKISTNYGLTTTEMKKVFHDNAILFYKL